MSATGRGATRREGDAYYTPDWAVYRFLEACPLWPGGLWLEPCVGSGAIVRAVYDWHRSQKLDPPDWRVSDLKAAPDFDLRVCHQVQHIAIGDYTRGAMDGEIRSGSFSVCLTNPPYQDAHRFVVQALTQCDTVVMLLRLNWLASAERRDWLAEHTPDVYVLPNRPDFTGDGGDATEYAWMVWRPFGASTRLPRLKILATTPAAERRAA